ncbi:MAG: hypothetical protein D6742_07235 [Cyanobacteria bacterium J069]|nr:MAG: hypothetical protein D6742_07235 [Cyanobacteria bacterium J069]
MEVAFTGPYSWPKFEAESNLPPVPPHPGLYLFAFEYRDGYLIYSAGITRRTIATRIREHTRKYISGDYHILNVSALKEGIREVIWQGWGWTPEKRATFEERQLEILDSARNQLLHTRLFAAEVDPGPRILERLEASIMNTLYQHSSPVCDIPDRGMMLSPRWSSEQPIIVRMKTDVLFHGLPNLLEI